MQLTEHRADIAKIAHEVVVNRYQDVEASSGSDYLILHVIPVSGDDASADQL